MDQPAHPYFPELPVAVVGAQVLIALRSEEQEIRHDRLTVRPAGKSVNAHIARPGAFAQVLVQALEQAAVEEGYIFKQCKGFVGLLEQIAVAVKTVRHEVLLVLCPAALIHFRIQRGEEKVLKNGRVVAA